VTKAACDKERDRARPTSCGDKKTRLLCEGTAAMLPRQVFSDVQTCGTVNGERLSCGANKRWMVVALEFDLDPFDGAAPLHLVKLIDQSLCFLQVACESARAGSILGLRDTLLLQLEL